MCLHLHRSRSRYSPGRVEALESIQADHLIKQTERYVILSAMRIMAVNFDFKALLDAHVEERCRCHDGLPQAGDSAVCIRQSPTAGIQDLYYALGMQWRSRRVREIHTNPKVQPESP